MNDTTTTDAQATDAEREAARQIVEIVSGIERGLKASRRQAAQWTDAVNLGKPHIESEQFRDELSEQAAKTLAGSAFFLALFWSHLIESQFEGQE